MNHCRLRAGLCLAALVLLSGCESPMFEDTIFDKNYIARQLPSEEKVLRDVSFEPRPTGVVQTYCYKTLASVDCYSQPHSEERYRLNGYFGPAPD